MRITDLTAGLSVLEGHDLRLAFANDGLVFVPCAAEAADRIAVRDGPRLEAAGWGYDVKIQAFVLRDEKG